MKCQNRFCIYQKDDICTLDEEAELDINGMCINCIYPDIPEKMLNQEKEKLLKLYDEEENRWYSEPPPLSDADAKRVEEGLKNFD